MTRARAGKPRLRQFCREGRKNNAILSRKGGTSPGADLMARYVVEEETGGRAGGSRVGVGGLAVAKALARKKAQKESVAVVVRDAETGEVLARYESSTPAESPSLANSVRRMRAANDRLKQRLMPPSRTKRGA